MRVTSFRTFSINERISPERKGVIVAPRRAGKSTYIDRMKLNALKDAYLRIRRAVLDGEMDGLKDLLKGVDLLELSPWEYDYLVERGRELDILREYLENVYVLVWDEASAKEFLKRKGISKSPEKVKVRLESLRREVETYHPDLTVWKASRREIDEERAAFLLDRIYSPIKEFSRLLRDLLGRVGMEAGILVATSLGGYLFSGVAALLSLAKLLRSSDVPVALEWIVKLRSLHPHELEELERSRGVEPRFLERLCDHLIGAGTEEKKVRKLEDELRRLEELLRKHGNLSEELKELRRRLEEYIGKEVHEFQEKVLELLGLQREVLEQILPYTILKSADEMREFVRYRIPSRDEIVGMESLRNPWYRRFMEEVIEEAGRRAVAITGPPGVGKTVFLYLLVEELISRGLPVAYLDESRLKGAGLGSFHVKEGIVLVLDDLSDTETFSRIVDSNYFRGVIYTARSYIQDTLEMEYGKKLGDRLARRPLTPDREASLELLREMMRRKRVTLVPDDLERLYERLKTRSGSESGIFLKYASLLAREYKGRRLEIDRIPRFADYIAEVLGRRLAGEGAGVFRGGWQPVPGKEREFAVNMLMLMLVSLHEGRMGEGLAEEIEEAFATRFGLDRGDVAIYRRILYELSVGGGERLVMDHFTYYLLFTPNPLREFEKNSFMGGEMPEDLFKGMKKALRILIRGFDIRDRVMSVYGIDPSLYLEYCRGRGDIVPLTRLSALLVSSTLATIMGGVEGPRRCERLGVESLAASLESGLSLGCNVQ